MDILFEMLGGLFGELYIDMVMSLIPSKKLKKSVQVFLEILCIVVFVCTFFVILVGASMVIEPERDGDVRNGSVMIAVGVSVVVLHIAMYVVNICVKRRRTKKLKSIIGTKVHVTIDRKIGTAHPKYPDKVYEVNYGYIAGIDGGDGEDQDAYVLGIDEQIGRAHV